MNEDDPQIDDAALLSWLADGVDPFSGEVFPPDHVLQRPQIIRALFHAILALKPAKPATDLPAAAGKPWSKEEDGRLEQEFDAAMPIKDIAALHNRSRGAITSRLVRLGKIATREDAGND